MTSDERWTRWVRAGLRERRIPAEASLTIRIEPSRTWLIDELSLTLAWNDRRGVPRRLTITEPYGVLRGGWHGWVAYRAGARMLRALG